MLELVDSVNVMKELVVLDDLHDGIGRLIAHHEGIGSAV